MIVYTTNVMALPLLAAVWVIDVYLCMAVFRLILSMQEASWAQLACRALQPLTDEIPRRVEQVLVRWRHRPAPTWLPWVAVIAGAAMLRHLFIWILISVSRIG